ncbi:MAG: FeoB-associated Cys-rich membrane protein [bacterium]
MNQDLIVLVIVALTIGYVFYSLIKNLRVKKVNNGCGGCSGCSVSKGNLTCSNSKKI